jgi:hypothetical protein
MTQLSLIEGSAWRRLLLSSIACRYLKSDMPVKWACILEYACNLVPHIVPPTRPHPAGFLRTQWPASCHRPHYVVRLLHPPQIVCRPLHHALNGMTVPNLYPVLIKQSLHCIPWNTLWPVLMFLDQGATVDSHLLGRSMMAFNMQKPESRTTYCPM